MPQLPDIQTMASNILALHSQANPNELRDGLTWYAEARAYCNSLASEFGLSLDIVASVLAALSPNCSWEINKRDTRATIQAHVSGTEFPRVSTYSRNLRKAIDILQTGNASLLSGQKVTNFAKCILSANTKAVCIDSHAYCIATGKEYTTQTMPTITKRNYAAIAQAYRLAARKAGIAPYKIQAITWVTRRKILQGEHNQYALPIR